MLIILKFKLIRLNSMHLLIINIGESWFQRNYGSLELPFVQFKQFCLTVCSDMKKTFFVVEECLKEKKPSQQQHTTLTVGKTITFASVNSQHSLALQATVFFNGADTNKQVSITVFVFPRQFTVVIRQLALTRAACKDALSCVKMRYGWK